MDNRKTGQQENKKAKLASDSHLNLSIDFKERGIIYAPEPSINENWLINPYSFGNDSELVAFLAQLEEEGYAQFTENGLLLMWGDLYTLHELKEYSLSVNLLRTPEIKSWRPVLSSRGGFTDKDFSITIAGWINPNGKPISANVQIIGAILSSGQDKALLPKDAYEVVIAVDSFHRRFSEERTPQSNRHAWSVIRRSAIKADAELTHFLRKTVVITPEHLELELRKSVFGESKTVEIIPSFEGAPERWLEIFDGNTQVRDQIDVPDKEGLVHVIITPEVKMVLREIKSMPGRRVAGDRAEAFIRNPFATLGPDAEKVINPEEFERARNRAGITFSRFSAQVLRDEQSFPYEIALLIEEASEGGVNSYKLNFDNLDDLDRFIRKLEDRITNEAQCCHWEGYDLEILGDTPDQLSLLKQAFIDRQRRDRITHAELFDLSHYSDRIEGFGVEKSYYSPYIARKDDGEGWFPENIDPVLFYNIPGSDEPFAIRMTPELHSQFKKMFQEAKDNGQEAFDFPGCPKPVPVKEADQILKTWDEAIKDVHEGEFKPRKVDEPAKKTVKMGLVIKPNITNLDYIERRDSLALGTDVKPLLPTTLKESTQLKDHQLRGVAWLQHLWGRSPEHCRGAVLADDMGLGKTLQLLAFITKCIEDDPNIDPFLVVAPVSLLENWKEEYNKFFESGSISILTLYGSSIADKRMPAELIDDELKNKNIKRLLKSNWIGDAKLVLTTYETLRDLEFSLAREKWSGMICDEAQKIKNPNALVTRSAKKQNVRFKIACTGTPVENTLTDLWCLFDFIQPGLLGALNYFGTRYRRPIEAETDEEKTYVEELRNIIAPQMLRRNKIEVAKDLPDKTIVQDCRELQISNRQRELYGHAISQFRLRNNEGSDSTFKNHLGVLQYLRRLCSDPMPIGQVSSTYEPYDEIMKNSPKMAWLMRALDVIRAKGEKAIVFCEFRDIQRKMQRCISEKFNFVADIINGETQAGGRQRRLELFQNNPGFGVIILSPLAIGFGVNIQAANHVIHFTRTWNPAKEDQATDRAYRIGQTKEVSVYYPVVVADFITFDAKLDRLLDWKRGLSKDVLNGTGELNPTDFGDIEDVDGSTVFSNDLINPKELSALSPSAFEAFCTVLWASKGFSKTYRTPSCGDSGVDVVALKNNQGALIQCKTSSEDGKQLGWDAVKDVIAGTEIYKRRHPEILSFQRIAVTNQYFNESAHYHAKINDVELIDRDKLSKLLDKTPVKRMDLEKVLIANWE